MSLCWTKLTVLIFERMILWHPDPTGIRLFTPWTVDPASSSDLKQSCYPLSAWLLPPLTLLLVSILVGLWDSTWFPCSWLLPGVLPPSIPPWFNQLSPFLDSRPPPEPPSSSVGARSCLFGRGRTVTIMLCLDFVCHFPALVCHHSNCFDFVINISCSSFITFDMCI